METNPNLSESLHELAQALEQLVHTLEQEKAESKELVSGARTLMAISHKIKKNAGEPEHIKKDVRQLIKEKHKKAYIKNYLRRKGILVADSTGTLKADNYLFGVVEYLADHYDQLEDFYSQLRFQQHKKKNFVFKPSKSSIKYISQWCSMLREYDIIDSYQLSEKGIYVDINEIHEATQFIYGYWLEILLRMEVGEQLRKNIDRIESFDIAGSVHILKPDESNSELDLVLMINDRILWFECKSGVIHSYYEKFNEHRQLMGLSQEQSFLVIPDDDANIALQTLKRSGMTTLYGTDLNNQLPDVLFTAL